MLADKGADDAGVVVGSELHVKPAVLVDVDELADVERLQSEMWEQFRGNPDCMVERRREERAGLFRKGRLVTRRVPAYYVGRYERPVHDNSPLGAIKLELYALLLDANVAKHVHARAGELLNEHLEMHKVAIRGLPDERRQLYRHIRRQAAKPEPEPWELPPSIEGTKDGNTKLDRHLYVPDAGQFTATLNDWERHTLKSALADENAVGWLRNDPRKPWSFTIPYEAGKDYKPMYPDFVVFRRQGAGLVCDILEPHALAWADSAAKAKGLAAFARDHGAEFGRIQLIAKVGGSYKTLALDDIETRDKVLGVATDEHLKQLF